MAKNLIPEVCKLLGVEVGEEFKIKDTHSSYISSSIYLIDEYGIVRMLDDNGSSVCAISLDDFLTGRIYEIVKLPWKPKEGEEYWTFDYSLDIVNNKPFATWEVCSKQWCKTSVDFALFEKGWVYRTKEEAQFALPNVAKELEVEYEVE